MYDTAERLEKNGVMVQNCEGFRHSSIFPLYQNCITRCSITCSPQRVLHVINLVPHFFLSYLSLPPSAEKQPPSYNHKSSTRTSDPPSTSHTTHHPFKTITICKQMFLYSIISRFRSLNNCSIVLNPGGLDAVHSTYGHRVSSSLTPCQNKNTQSWLSTYCRWRS